MFIEKKFVKLSAFHQNLTLYHLHFDNYMKP